MLNTNANDNKKLVPILNEMEQIMSDKAQVLKDNKVYGQMAYITALTRKQIDDNSLESVEWLRQVNDKLETIYEALDHTAKEFMNLDDESPAIVNKKVENKQEDCIEARNEITKLREHTMKVA